MPFNQPLLVAFIVELTIVCAFLCVDIDFGLPQDQNQESKLEIGFY